MVKHENDRAIVVFGRIPEQGKVKTRLAERMGSDITLSVYRAILRHTISTAMSTGHPVYFFYEGELENGDAYPGIVLIKQAGSDFGQKLDYVFRYVFEKLGYAAIAVVGTDCTDLDEQDFRQAFQGLASNDAMMGQSKDGGYYLLATNGYKPSLLAEIAWSTEHVARQTAENASKSGLKLGLLDKVAADIDTPADLDKYLSEVKNTAVYKEIQQAIKK